MLEKYPQILVIPIDNRPVCYDLIKDTAKIFNGLNIHLPDKKLLGNLNSAADVIGLQNWVKETIINNDIDIAIFSLDTLVYGGLVPSRRTSANFDEVKSYVDSFVSILKSSQKNIKTYAMSSIMRISNNNYNEEEKSYWGTYGVDLFRYSYLSHKLLKSYNLELEAELIALSKKIPFEVIEDYLDTRKRNFDINSYYIDLLRDGVFEHLVFAQDDSAEYGLNVEEKELLHRQSIKELVSDKVTIKNGADEILLSLLSKSLVDYCNEDIKIYPFYAEVNNKNIISRYEDVSIENSVNSSIKLCGAKVSANFQDLQLIINTPNKIQDDLCLGIYADDKSTEISNKIIRYLEKMKQQYAIADIKNANGADNNLVNEFLAIPFDDNDFYGYAAWNTTGNTLGTVIATMVIKCLAKKYDVYNIEAFKKSQYIRLLDDWAYQANVRKILRDKGATESVNEEMFAFVKKTSDYLDFQAETSFSFPWDRTFEVQIDC